MKILTFITVFILTSCCNNGVHKAQEAYDSIHSNTHKIDLHANAIKSSSESDRAHIEAIKASTEAIRDDSDSLLSVVRELNDELTKKGSWFKAWVSLIPIILGVICLVIGRATNSPRDTISGIVLFICGIGCYMFWSVMGWIGLIIMLGAIIAWAIIKQEEISIEKRRLDL